ncbi:MAG: hypothetical protein EBV53_14875, partial [Proteobacteria bacterium]|nr:hypothetical protein [Pseudomonadota bacterium]
MRDANTTCHPRGHPVRTHRDVTKTFNFMMIYGGGDAKLAKIDPATAARLQPNDSQRVQRALEVYEISGKTMTQLHQLSTGDDLPYRLLKIALVPSDRSVLHARIASRFDEMLKHG